MSSVEGKETGQGGRGGDEEAAVDEIGMKNGLERDGLQ